MLYKYRYPSEDWQEIEGTKYTLEDIQPYAWWYFFCDAISMSSQEGCGTPVTLISRGRIFGRLIEATIATPVDSFGEYISFDALIEDRFGRQYRQSIGVSYSPTLGTASSATVRLADNCQSRVLYVLPNNFGEIYAGDRWRDTNPGNNNECKFTVFLENDVVFERTQWGCPEVELIGEEEEKVCPEGTCQVSCGNVYCCYDSSGIAVSSISK